MSDRKLSVFLYATLLIAFIFGIYLSSTKMTDPFLYIDVAYAKTVNMNGEINFPEQGTFSPLALAPGRQVLMVQLMNMMGVSADLLQFFPLGTIFVSITLFLLAFEIIKSPIISSVLTLYLVLNLSHATALYSVFAYALGFPLMLGFFIIGKNILKYRNILEFPLLLLLFSALNFIHYTLTFWTIIFAVATSLIIEVQRLLRNDKIHELKPVFYLSLAFIVFFLIFNQTLYNSYIPNLAPETLDSAVQRFFSFFIFNPKLFDSPYAYVRSPTINYISSITLFLILAPVTIGFIKDFWSLFIKKKESFILDNEIPVVWAIIILGIVDAVTYSLRGSISTKSFSMIFPIITLYYLKKIKYQYIHIFMAFILLFTSIVKIPIFYNQSYFIRGNGSTVGDIEASTEWMQSNIALPEYVLMADLNLYGKYLSSSVENGYAPTFRAFDDNSYELIVNGTGDLSVLMLPDFIAIDKKSTQPTIGFIWNIFMPLAQNLDKIRTNNLLSIVYEDESILIMRFSNADEIK